MCSASGVALVSFSSRIPLPVFECCGNAAMGCTVPGSPRAEKSYIEAGFSHVISRRSNDFAHVTIKLRSYYAIRLREINNINWSL